MLHHEWPYQAHISFFLNYLSNEFHMPVVDETGLAGTYDIVTENALRSKEEVIKAVEKIGFRMEESRKKMPVLVIYK